MSFTVYLVRHGQTILNRYNRMQGWCDSDLTTLGISQAQQTGKRLANIKFDHAFHSDTIRATQTCQNILAQNHNLVPAHQESFYFREEGYGYYEGADSGNAWMIIGGPHGCKTFSEIISTYSIEDAKNFAKAADPFDDAEDNAEFWHRLDCGFDLLRSVATDDQNVLLVSHGTTIRSIVARFAPEIDITVSPKNGSVTKLIVDQAEVKVDYFNQSADDFAY